MKNTSRSLTVTFTCNAYERAALDLAATRAGVSISEFVRQCLSGPCAPFITEAFDRALTRHTPTSDMTQLTIDAMRELTNEAKAQTLRTLAEALAPAFPSK